MTNDKTGCAAPIPSPVSPPEKDESKGECPECGNRPILGMLYCKDCNELVNGVNIQ